MNSSRRPPPSPLTRDQLRAIYETNPTPAVKRLLWEIKRLRGIVVLANSLFVSMDRARHSGARLTEDSQKILDQLRHRIRLEPASSEDPRSRPDD